MSTFAKTLSLVVTLLIAGPFFAMASETLVVDSAVAPTLSCKYETFQKRLGRESRNNPGVWSFWRTPNMVVRQNEAFGGGEVWTRTAQQNLTFQEYLIDQREVITYAQADLAATVRTVSWEQLVSLIEPDIASHLATTGTTEFMGREVTRYSGTVGQRHLEVLWLDKEQIPAEIRIDTGPVVTVTRLLELPRVGKRALPVPDLAGYHEVSFSSLGGLDVDPFVQNVLRSGSCAPRAALKTSRQSRTSLYEDEWDDTWED